MNKFKREVFNIMGSLIVCAGMTLPWSAVMAASLDTIQVLKISPQDQRAVVKTPDGTMQIIKPGDMVGNDSKVVEVTAGRVMFEEKTGSEKETVIIRLEDGKQQVERIKKAPEKQVHLYSPRSAREQKQER